MQRSFLNLRSSGSISISRLVEKPLALLLRSPWSQNLWREVRCPSRMIQDSLCVRCILVIRQRKRFCGCFPGFDELLFRCCSWGRHFRADKTYHADLDFGLRRELDVFKEAQDHGSFCDVEHIDAGHGGMVYVSGRENALMPGAFAGVFLSCYFHLVKASPTREIPAQTVKDRVRSSSNVDHRRAL